MTAYKTEFIGTLTLSLAVAFSLANQNFPVPTPVVAGLTLGLLVYILGPLSGAHFNPAITIGLWSIGKINMHEAGRYIVAQLAGGLVAFFLTQTLIDPAQLNVLNTSAVGFGELVGALFFGFGVVAVATGKVPVDISGAVVGGSLLIGISLASYSSNGILNPAVALGLGSFSLMYVIGPVLGAVIGMKIFKHLTAGKQSDPAS